MSGFALAVVIRGALARLEGEGRLPHAGQGAFVSKKRLTNASPDQFTQDMLQRNMTPGSKVLAKEFVPCTPFLSSKLQIHNEEHVFMLKRLRMADNSPMAIEVCFLPESIGRQIVDHLVDNASLYQLLAEKCGIQLKYAMQTIEVGTLEKIERDLLGQNCPRCTANHHPANV